jgi:hypothetical protein
VDVTATLDAPCSRAALYPWIDDLASYPRWLDIVPRAVSVAPHADDVGPAWSVDLRARLGPSARPKRHRWARPEADPGGPARFERPQHAARQHSAWVLDARIDEQPAGCRLTMRLHYGGRMWVPALDRLLADEINRSRPRLLACVEGSAG